MARIRTASGAQTSRPPRLAVGRNRRVLVRHLRESHSKLEVKRLQKQAEDLSARIAELEREAEAARDTETDHVIVLRDISKEQARNEILEAFESDEPLDHADLAEVLRLEISMVFEVCNELIDEGLVVFYDGSGH